MPCTETKSKEKYLVFCFYVCVNNRGDLCIVHFVCCMCHPTTQLAQRPGLKQKWKKSDRYKTSLNKSLWGREQQPDHWLERYYFQLPAIIKQLIFLRQKITSFLYRKRFWFLIKLPRSCSHSQAWDILSLWDRSEVVRYVHIYEKNYKP